MVMPRVTPEITFGNLLQIFTIGVGGVGALVTLVFLLGDLRAKDAVHDQRFITNEDRIMSLEVLSASLDRIARQNQTLIQSLVTGRAADRELRRELKNEIQGIKQSLAQP